LPRARVGIAFDDVFKFDRRCGCHGFLYHKPKAGLSGLEGGAHKKALILP
jgi:hypothetical protein